MVLLNSFPESSFFNDRIDGANWKVFWFNMELLKSEIERRNAQSTNIRNKHQAIKAEIMGYINYKAGTNRILNQLNVGMVGKWPYETLMGFKNPKGPMKSSLTNVKQHKRNYRNDGRINSNPNNNKHFRKKIINSHQQFHQPEIF